MSRLCVRSATTPGTSSIAEPLVFDFASDIPDGETILRYGVGLAGFVMNYDAQSSYWAENMGLMSVSIVPNLVGNKILASASAVLSDYDYDSGRDQGGSSGNPVCTVMATAIALIGVSYSQNEVVLGNLYGIANGQTQGGIAVATDPFCAAFLAGFSVAGAGGKSASISSLTYSVSDHVDQGQGMMSVSGAAGAGSMSTVATVDALAMAAASTITGFEVVTLPLTWGDSNYYDGKTANFMATFHVPSGQKIVNVGLLQQSVDIVYGAQAEFQLVGAYPGNVTISGSQVTGTYTLNIFNPDFGARTYIDDSSTAIVYAIAQFGANS